MDINKFHMFRVGGAQRAVPFQNGEYNLSLSLSLPTPNFRSPFLI